MWGFLHTPPKNPVEGQLRAEISLIRFKIDKNNVWYEMRVNMSHKP